MFTGSTFTFCLYRVFSYFIILIPGYEEKKILRLSKIAAVAAAAAFTIFVTYIYTASSEFGILSKQKYVGAWQWWSLQTVLRLEEVVSCSLVIVIAFRNPCGEYSELTGCFCKTRKTTITPVDGTNVKSPDVTVSAIQFNSD